MMRIASVRWSVLTLALALSAGAADAPPSDASAADTKAAAELPKLAVEQYELDNGLTVILNRDPRLPVVAVEVRYLVGSGHEREGRSGFAHLFEHLMFQGSKHHDKEYFGPFEPIGGSVNGTTNQDRTNYYERVPRNYLELALWMESDRMQHLLPALDQSKLDNQRDVVKNERRQRYENEPYGMSWIYLSEALFPKGHPYHNSVIGSHEDLSAATLDDVRAFFNEYYAPANAVLTISGDFDEAQTKALIETYFGAIPAGKRASAPAAPKVERGAPVHVTKTDNVKLPRVYLAWNTPALYAEGDAELDLLSSILTDGKTSRLYEPLVYDKKVAKTVNAYQVSLGLGSFFVVDATAAPGVSVETLSKELDRVLKAALATPPTADELERALNKYKKSYYSRLQGVLERAQLLSVYYQFTGRADYLAQDLGRYLRATPTKVQQAGTRFLGANRVRLDIVPGDKVAQGGAR